MLAALVIAGSHLIGPFQATFQTLVGERLNAYIGEQIILAANRWRGLARFEDPAFADDLNVARRYATRGGLDILLLWHPVCPVGFHLSWSAHRAPTA